MPPVASSAICCAGQMEDALQLAVSNRLPWYSRWLQSWSGIAG